MLQRLFEDLRLQRLLAEQPMQLANLTLWMTSSPLPGSCQPALRYQTTPREQLVRSDPVPLGHQAYRHPGA
jgi:hypothetical protein